MIASFAISFSISFSFSRKLTSETQKTKSNKIFLSISNNIFFLFREVFDFDDPPLHDPTAIAYVIDPTLFQTVHKTVLIETKSSICNGRTVVDLYERLGRKKNAHVAVKMDVPKFWDLMLDAFEKANRVSCVNQQQQQ